MIARSVTKHNILSNKQPFFVVFFLFLFFLLRVYSLFFILFELAWELIRWFLAIDRFGVKFNCSPFKTI